MVRSGRNINASENVRLSLLHCICKSHKDHIKTKTGYAPDKSEYEALCHSRASNSVINNPISSEFELAQNIMSALVLWKYDENPIKNEGAILRTKFSK